MMKRILSIVLLLILLMLSNLSVNAQDTYKEQFDASGFDSVYDSLPEEAKEYFSSFSVDLSDYNWVDEIKPQSVFERIIELVKTGFKGPLAAFAACSAIMLITAAVKSLADRDDDNKTIGLVCMFGICSVTVIPICSLITSLESALKGCSTFMLSFVPVYTGILTVSGRTSSAVSGGLLLSSAEAVSMLTSFAVIPTICATLALGISSAPSPLSLGNKAAESLKKISVWCIGTLATVFTGILSMQTVIGSVADNMKMRTAKMFTSSVVPVVGSALSESLSTVVTCFSMLRSTAGIFGIVALCVIVLPILIEIALWRLCIMLLGLLASFLNLSQETAIIGAVDSALSLMCGATLIISMLFIISLTVTVFAGGTV